MTVDVAATAWRQCAAPALCSLSSLLDTLLTKFLSTPPVRRHHVQRYLPNSRKHIYQQSFPREDENNHRISVCFLFLFPCPLVPRSFRLCIRGTAVHNVPHLSPFVWHSRPWNHCPRGAFSLPRVSRSRSLVSPIAPLSCYLDELSILADHLSHILLA